MMKYTSLEIRNSGESLLNPGFSLGPYFQVGERLPLTQGTGRLAKSVFIGHAFELVATCKPINSFLDVFRKAVSIEDSFAYHPHHKVVFRNGSKGRQALGVKTREKWQNRNIIWLDQQGVKLSQGYSFIRHQGLNLQHQFFLWVWQNTNPRKQQFKIEIKVDSGGLVTHNHLSRIN